MRLFATSDLLAAVRELSRTHGTDYTYDCCVAALRYRLIDTDQFTSAMRVLYP